VALGRYVFLWRSAALSVWNGGQFSLVDFPMTTRPERFRVKAMECHAAAQKADDPATREAYLELMRNWRELADEVERFEHTWLDREGI